MAKRKVVESNPFCNCLGAQHIVCRPFKVTTAKDTCPPPSDKLLRYGIKPVSQWDRRGWDDRTASAWANQAVTAALTKLGDSETFRYTPPHYHTFGEWSEWTPCTVHYRRDQAERTRTCACGGTDTEYMDVANATIAA